MLGKNAVDAIIRTGDDMGADDFTGLGRCGGTGIDRGFHCCDIAGDDGIAERIAYLFHRAEELDVC